MSTNLPAETPPRCATCGAPFYRRAVMMLGDGHKQMQDLCRAHTAEVRKTTLNSSSSVVAGTEFWDWPTTQRYQRMAAEGHTITHMGEVMTQLHSERPMGHRRPAGPSTGELGIAQVEPGIWLVNIAKHPDLGTAIEHRLHELRIGYGSAAIERVVDTD
jgi:hypothetical protein